MTCYASSINPVLVCVDEQLKHCQDCRALCPHADHSNLQHWDRQACGPAANFINTSNKQLRQACSDLMILFQFLYRRLSAAVQVAAADSFQSVLRPTTHTAHGAHELPTCLRVMKSNSSSSLRPQTRKNRAYVSSSILCRHTIVH